MKLLHLILFLALSIAASAQVITDQLSTVPNGLWWRLEESSSTIIEVNEITLVDGSLCQALFNGGKITTIIEGVAYSGKHNYIYDIKFKHIEKVQGANAYTYRISGLTFDCLNSATGTLTHPVSIYFEQKQCVWTSDCLNSIKFIEYNAIAHE